MEDGDWALAGDLLWNGDSDQATPRLVQLALFDSVSAVPARTQRDRLLAGSV